MDGLNKKSGSGALCRIAKHKSETAGLVSNRPAVSLFLLNNEAEGFFPEIDVYTIGFREMGKKRNKRGRLRNARF